MALRIAHTLASFGVILFVVVALYVVTP